MKKYLTFMAFAIMAIFSLSLVSCSSDDDDDDDKKSSGSFSHAIVGTWNRDGRDGRTKITFNSNKTAALTEISGDVTSVATGDYTIEGNKFTIHFTKISAMNTTVEIDKTDSGYFEIEGNKMTVTAADNGDVTHWTRQ